MKKRMTKKQREKKQRDEVEAMDAQVLALLREKIENHPDDEEWKRLYAISKAATRWKDVPSEHKEAVIEELNGMLNKWV